MEEREDRPAYVRFKRVAVEDKAESLRQGRPVFKDMDYAMVTAPYSRDTVDFKLHQWLSNMEQDVANGRMPKEWQEKNLKLLEAWRSGQELPVDGHAIRGWGAISPAQQEMLLRLNILTIEDLANVNDEGVRRIGMGAMDLKTKAQAWLRELNDAGKNTVLIAALQQENTNLKANLDSALERLAQIERRILQAPVAGESNTSISADDILPESEPVRRQNKK